MEVTDDRVGHGLIDPVMDIARPGAHQYPVARMHISSHPLFHHQTSSRSIFIPSPAAMTFNPNSFSNSAATTQGFALIIVIPKWVRMVNLGFAFLTMFLTSSIERGSIGSSPMGFNRTTLMTRISPE